MRGFIRRIMAAGMMAILAVLTACTARPPREIPTLAVMPSTSPTTAPVLIASGANGQHAPLIPIGDTATPTLTATPSLTATWTVTASATNTPTNTPSITPTSSKTFTPTVAPSPTLDLTAPELQAIVRTAATAYAGPGVTYESLGVLNAKDAVRILERNDIGNWVHIWKTDRSGKKLVDGWVMTGYLNVSAELRFSRLRVNTALTDADLKSYTGETIAPLYAAPVIPHISPTMRDVFLKGQTLGNGKNVITKIGDSVTANMIYLTPMRFGNEELGPYDYLDETIRYFGKSLENDSIAARKGLSSYGVFDPLNSVRACEADETPLACEYRLKKPSVAFIMFGPNDIWSMDADEFDTQMRMVVDETLKRGIIPVLTTFSADPRNKSWEHSIEFNIAVVAIGHDYDVPVMNLWLASRDLPGYGLEGDGIHMKNYGYNQIKFDLGLDTRFGTNLQNLVAIRTLDEIRRTIIAPPR